MYGWAQSGIRPRLTGARPWIRDHRDLGYRYLVENTCVSGAGQLRAYGLGAIVGVGAVGVVRGAELLQGPFLAVLMGLTLVTVAEAARMLRQARTGSAGSVCSWAAARRSPPCCGAACCC